MAKKAISVLLIISLLFSLLVFNSSYASAVTYPTSGFINGTNVYIRSGPSTSASSVAKVSNISVTVLGEGGTDTSGYLWYQIDYNGTKGYVRSDLIIVNDNTPVSDGTDDFEQQIAAFPESYRSSLRNLHSIYPNWKFIADNIPLNFEDVVYEESIYKTSTGCGRKLVNMASDGISWRSMAEGHYNWSTGVWTTTSGNWCTASREVVSYYLDPRNFLNINSVYAFMRQSYDILNHTAAGVEKIISGTFLANGYYDANDTAYGGSYVNVIMEAARQSGVSPYIIAATIILEQGVNGTSDLISGKNTSYPGCYNFFNVKASGSDVIGNGLRHAQSQGWTTRSASIIGGAKFYGENYVSAGQDTYYYKDFDVLDSTPYTHQYAQSVYDQVSSAARIRPIYIDKYDMPLTFRIPVYKNMPATPPSQPEENNKLNNYYLTLISVPGLSPAFNMFHYNYTLTVHGNTNIKIAVPNGASYSGQSSYQINAGTQAIYLSVTSQSGYITYYAIVVNASVGCTITVGTNEPPPATVINGDTNGDGVVTIIDLANVQKHLLGLITLSGNNYTGADTNKDGAISIIDLANIQKHLLGLITLK